MPSAAPTTNGTMPNGEPRKVRTLTVHGDQADASAVPTTAPPAAAPPPAPATKPTAATRQVPPAPAMRTAPASAGNAPLSLSPDSAQASVPAPAEPRTRMAATTPTQIEPAEQAPVGEGRFLVSVTSQPTESEAQSSYRAMQRKYPDQLGSRTPIIKKVDKKAGGAAYRALVGPFASREEATRFCTSYSSAGGQCWVP
jgi:hypothetical protein